jgi:hypothetical protein
VVEKLASDGSDEPLDEEHPAHGDSVQDSGAHIAESWVATFHLEDGVEQLGRRAFGARSRDLLRISSWCLRSMDSATTERVPPGLSNRRAVQMR